MSRVDPLTAAQRAYLAAFDDYLADATRDSERRREFSLAVLLFEADVRPYEAAPEHVERSFGQQGARAIGDH